MRTTLAKTSRKVRIDVGQKIHPYGLRLGVINDWKSRWIADKEYPKLVQEDIRIRRYLTERLENAAVSSIEIERKAKQLSVDVFSARPGIIIGRKGSEVGACCQEHRRPDLRKGFVQKGDEEGRRQHDEAWRPGNKGPVQRTPRRRRDGEARVVSRGACPTAYAQG